jgi:hypothetical protein
LFLDGVYRTDGGTPVSQPIPAPSVKQLQTHLSRIVKKIWRDFTRQVDLIVKSKA